jgi:hypothetical protein
MVGDARASGEARAAALLRRKTPDMRFDISKRARSAKRGAGFCPRVPADGRSDGVVSADRGPRPSLRQVTDAIEMRIDGRSGASPTSQRAFSSDLIVSIAARDVL